MIYERSVLIRCEASKNNSLAAYKSSRGMFDENILSFCIKDALYPLLKRREKTSNGMSTEN